MPASTYNFLWSRGTITFALFGFWTARAGAQELTNSTASILSVWGHQDYMLGSWGGLRPELDQRGVDFEFLYAGSFPDNLSGGLRRGGVYQGGVLATMDLDSQKLVGYEGGTFHVSGAWINGDKPFSDRYVGDINKVNLLDLPNSFRLWEISYQQRVSTLTFRAGILSIDTDFVVPELYTGFGQATLLNQTFFYPSLLYNLFDIPGLPPRDHGVPTSPSTAPGALVRWDATPSLYAEAGVYGGNPDQTEEGTHPRLSQHEGALTAFEFGYRLNHSREETGLEGVYKFGGYYHTGEFVDVEEGTLWAFFNTTGGAMAAPFVSDHGGNYAGYFVAEQQLFYEVSKADPAKRGLVSFFRLLGAPADRNLTQLEVDGGLVYRGLIPHRDWDTLGVAISYLGMSDNIRHAQESINQSVPDAFKLSDHETFVELNYKIQVTAWWTLQSSFQHVLHPGGSSSTADANVAILQTTFRL